MQSEREVVLEAAPSSPSISTNHSRSQLHHSSQHRDTEFHHSQVQSGIESRNTSSLNSQLAHTSQMTNYSNVIHSTTNQNQSTGPLYLHSDVLQQRYGNEISMLPVPRIVCPVLTDNSNSYSDTSLFPKRAQNMIGGSSDCTLDENMQLADMIAMKYVGNTLPSGQTDRLLTQPRRQLYVEGTLSKILSCIQLFIQTSLVSFQSDLKLLIIAPKVNFPIVLIHFKPPKRGQPLYNVQNGLSRRV